jgi:hypothetical protein
MLVEEVRWDRTLGVALGAFHIVRPQGRQYNTRKGFGNLDRSVLVEIDLIATICYQLVLGQGG